MKTRVTKSQHIVILLSIIITFTTLLFYGFIREGAALIILVLLVPLYYYISYLNSALCTVSFLVITLLLNFMIGVTGMMNKVYYEPNMMLEIFDFDFGLPIYLSNVRLKMTQPMGGLKAVNLRVDGDVEPRKIEFNTDSLGFRNDADYHNQKYLVVGDSFVVGLGNTQKDMLSSQLRQRYNLDTYSLSHPADITGYSRYVRAFQRKYGSEFKVFLFIYEGNDFPEKYTVIKHEKPITSRIGRHLKDLVRRYRNTLTRTNLYRLTYIKYENFRQRNNVTNKTFMENIHGHRIIFSREYSELAKRKIYKGNEDIENAIVDIKDIIECIFFIPTKYRVYHNFDKEKPDSDLLYNAQWDFLNHIAKKYNIQCINLTDAFVKEANKLLREENKLLWWADDSHWNKYGIAVAAKAVYEVLQAKEEVPQAQVAPEGRH